MQAIEDFGHGKDSLNGTVHTFAIVVVLLAANLLVELLLPLVAIIIMRLNGNHEVNPKIYESLIIRLSLYNVHMLY